MNKTLYEEALADAQQLRELAEETAKHRVLESIMPQIKSLVDSRILGEQTEAHLEDPLEDVQHQPDFLSTDSEELGMEDLEGPLSGDADGNIINVDADGDVHIDMSTASDDDDDFVLTDTMAEAVRDILVGKTKYTPTVSERVVILSKRVDKLNTKYKSS